MVASHFGIQRVVEHGVGAEADHLLAQFGDHGLGSGTGKAECGRHIRNPGGGRIPDVGHGWIVVQGQTAHDGMATFRPLPGVANIDVVGMRVAFPGQGGGILMIVILVRNLAEHADVVCDLAPEQETACLENDRRILGKVGRHLTTADIPGAGPACHAHDGQRHGQALAERVAGQLEIAPERGQLRELPARVASSALHRRLTREDRHRLRRQGN